MANVIDHLALTGLHEECLDSALLPFQIMNPAATIFRGDSEAGNRARTRHREEAKHDTAVWVGSGQALNKWA